MISFFIEKENKYFIGKENKYFIGKENKNFIEKENKKIPNLLVLPMSPEDWGFFILSQVMN